MIGEILPPGVESAELFHDPADLGLFPEERAQIARAVDKRQREYASARHCARAAMGRLGLDPVGILKDEKGAPQWPRGIVGSMTHTEGYRAAAVGFSMGMRSVGIDAEQHAPLPSDGVLSSVSLPAEREWLAAAGSGESSGSGPGEGGVHWDRLLFSAKESTYKAWYPLTERWLGFEDAHITFSLVHEGDSPAGTFHSRLLVPGGTLAGDELTGFDGRWVVRGGLVVTAIAVI
ncbi:4'-phosphopantetheinyl transferase family protein [Tomitella biformata]|uniref:4'-phosphopantetheinyl transferase family protein n=1 Tax=Tomitella biformata TaxID=630403 RepID=UPI0004659C31|nr:4'-phosphopantetheinyl transferase superfamily protein [Tomitella biformata]